MLLSTNNRIETQKYKKSLNQKHKKHNILNINKLQQPPIKSEQTEIHFEIKHKASNTINN